MVAVILLVVIVGFIAFWCLMGWAAIGTAVVSGKQHRRAVATARPTLNALFDGADQVVYAPRLLSGGLSTPDLVYAANLHGYRLVSETGTMAARTVVFAKKPASESKGHWVSDAT